jgi:hypothetical protein
MSEPTDAERKNWRLVFEALQRAKAELTGSWPAPRRYSYTSQVHRGYSRERGRRAII